MCCCCNYISIRNRALVKSCCNKTCNVCHIYEKISSNFFCDICKNIKTDLSWISRSSCYDHLWFSFTCKLSDCIVIQNTVIIDIVRYEIVKDTGKVYR